MITIDEKIKTSKQKLGEKIPCSIEVLTPVHIGSGVKLAEGIDFIKTDYSVHILSQAELMKYLEDNPDEMERFIDGKYKLNNLQRIPEGRKFNVNTKGLREILEFVRNGNGKPYIPGSSIKGAMRTILLKKRFDELSESQKNDLLKKVSNTKKEWAANPIVEYLLGKSSNENLMRTLEIFDSDFENVELEKIFILTLRNQNGSSYGWKKMGRDVPSQDDPKNATPIFAETLPTGSIGYFSISLNTFLMEDTSAQSTLHFNEQALKDIQNLRIAINGFSVKKLEKEKEFYEKLTSPKKLNSVLKEIDNLLSKINNLNKDEFILRISWGSGWKGMTGDYLDEEWINIFRNKYGRGQAMGRPGFTIFPKTRRLVFEDDEPKYLTGWIKVSLNKSVGTDKNQNGNISLGNSKDPMETLKQKFKVTETKKK
jgi:CRISPR-associated protein Csm5